MAFFMSLWEANSTTLEEHVKILLNKSRSSQSLHTYMQMWTYPSFFLVLCASTKVTSPTFLIKSLRSCRKKNAAVNFPITDTLKLQHPHKKHHILQHLLWELHIYTTTVCSGAVVCTCRKLPQQMSSYRRKLRNDICPVIKVPEHFQHHKSFRLCETTGSKGLFGRDAPGAQTNSENRFSLCEVDFCIFRNYCLEPFSNLWKRSPFTSNSRFEYIVFLLSSMTEPSLPCNYPV